MTPNKHLAAQNVQFKCITGTVVLLALPSETSEVHLILEEASDVSDLHCKVCVGKAESNGKR